MCCLLSCPIETDQLVKEGAVAAVVVVVQRILQDVLGVGQSRRGQLADRPLAVLEDAANRVQLE